MWAAAKSSAAAANEAGNNSCQIQGTVFFSVFFKERLPAVRVQNPAKGEGGAVEGGGTTTVPLAADTAGDGDDERGVALELQDQGI